MASAISSTKPISNASAGGKRAAIVFGGVFVLAGLGFFIPVFLLPAFRVLEAQSWRETPCTIVNSKVESHVGEKGGYTYSIKISYRYDYNAIHYVGTHYNFSIGSSSGRDYRQAIVNRLHRGVKTVCYVNPNYPAQAVLDRGMQRDMAFGLLPMVFVAIGLAIMIAGIRRAQIRPLSPSGAAVPSARSTKTFAHLKEAQSPFTKLLVILAIAALWNGIISVFVYHLYFVSDGPAPDRFAQIFMIPFVIIGVVLIAGCGHTFLALFNPRPRISFANDAIAIGQSCELRWSFTGNFSRIDRLSIVVQGSEQATCQRGTSTVIDTSIFARIRIADTTRQSDIGSGSGVFSIPPDTMHSFVSRHNKIIWSIVIHGEIARWPDVKSEFPFNVAPAALQQVQA